MKRFFALALALCLILSLQPPAKAEQSIDILLIGTDDLQDKITGKETMSRADALYVLRIHKDSGLIKMLAIERDYRVSLPDGDNKLATSTYFGGPKMCMDAVNQLLGLNLSLYAQIDITNVIKAIDMIGGVDVTIRKDEVDNINSFITGIMDQELKTVVEGNNHLNGHEAWAFLGFRDQTIDKIDSNKDRNDRQRRVMMSGMDRLRKVTMPEAMKLADSVLPFIKTNITMADILSLVQMVQKIDPDKVSYMRTPVTEYKKKTVNMHQVIEVKDMPLEIQKVHEFLQ